MISRLARTCHSSLRHTVRMSSSAAVAEEQPPLVMQLILDRSLVGNANWGVGPLMAQAAHAAMAVTAKTATKSATEEYIATEKLPRMHKIVLCNSEKQSLADISAKLTAAREAIQTPEEKEAFPEHYLWVEQPEDIPTVLAMAPNRKPPALKKILNKCSLLRA